MEGWYVKAGNQRHFPFCELGVKSMVWMGIHILKLVLAVMETTGSVAKIVLLVLA